MEKALLLTLLAACSMFNLFGQKKGSAEKAAFNFKEPENTACFVCDHVLSKQRPILYASHDKEDESWQFLCGQDDHTEANAKVISLKQATQIDGTINDLYEMPAGFETERKSAKEKWALFRLQD